MQRGDASAIAKAGKSFMRWMVIATTTRGALATPEPLGEADSLEADISRLAEEKEPNAYHSSAMAPRLDVPREDIFSLSGIEKEGRTYTWR